MNGIVKQLSLPKIQVAREVNGLEMGVLSDGTAYLSQKALSKLCGVANSSLSEASSEWIAGKRTSRLAKWLVAQGFDRESLYTKTQATASGATAPYAYLEDVSQMVLEYYAFESPTPSSQAVQNYRLLTRAGLRAFVYHALGFDPARSVPATWRQFHDRLLLANSPRGYFSVFKESADIILAAMRAGLPVDHQTVPDISIGKAWAAHWRANIFESRYGPAARHDHFFPDYFPQAASNPQEIWIYPVAALGVFRTWMQNVYIPEKFPAYLEKKVDQGLLPPSAVELFLAEATPLEPKLLPTST